MEVIVNRHTLREEKLWGPSSNKSSVSMFSVDFDYVFKIF